MHNIFPSFYLDLSQISITICIDMYKYYVYKGDYLLPGYVKFFEFEFLKGLKLLALIGHPLVPFVLFEFILMINRNFVMRSNRLS